MATPRKLNICERTVYQWNLLTGLYMLDPWERVLFSE